MHFGLEYHSLSQTQHITGIKVVCALGTVVCTSLAVGFHSITSCTLPSSQVRGCVRGPAILSSSTLSVVHIVDSVPVHFPRKVDRYETQDKPAEQYFKYCHSHVVGQPVVHEFRQKGHQTVNHTRHEFKIPRFLHTAVWYLTWSGQISN